MRTANASAVSSSCAPTSFEEARQIVDSDPHRSSGLVGPHNSPVARKRRILHGACEIFVAVGHRFMSRCDRRLKTTFGGPDETSPQRLSASDRGRCHDAGRPAHRKGADLSFPAGAHHRRLSPGRRSRHRGARHGSMAVGATRPAIRHREPTGRRHKCRDRRRSSRQLPTATRCSSPRSPMRSIRRSMTSSISTSSATLLRSPASTA